MAATQVLVREKQYEDLLGTGRTFLAPDRKYLRLADDLSFPRPIYSLEDLRRHDLRATVRRRFWEDLGTSASKQGVSLSRHAYAQGAHRETPDLEAS